MRPFLPLTALYFSEYWPRLTITTIGPYQPFIASDYAAVRSHQTGYSLRSQNRQPLELIVCRTKEPFARAAFAFAEILRIYRAKDLASQ